MKIEKKGAAGSNDPSILPYRTKITMEKFPTTFTDFFPLSVEARATYNDTEQSWHLKSREISDTSAAGDPKSKLYSRTFSPRSDFVFPFSHPSSLSLSLSIYLSIYLSVRLSLSALSPSKLPLCPGRLTWERNDKGANRQGRRAVIIFYLRSLSVLSAVWRETEKRRDTGDREKDKGTENGWTRGREGEFRRPRHAYLILCRESLSKSS